MNPIFESKGVSYFEMTPEHLADVVWLANLVHGANYLSNEEAEQFLERGQKNGINCCFVAFIDEELVGFRIAFAPSKWNIDKWCTPELWPAEPDKIGYFKCNTVHEDYRARSIGSNLMRLSMDAIKRQGAAAGICHTWMQSPGNSAYLYITKVGGEQIKLHKGKWAIEDYHCPVCNGFCSCEAAEMLVKL